MKSSVGHVLGVDDLAVPQKEELLALAAPTVTSSSAWPTTVSPIIASPARTSSSGLARAAVGADVGVAGPQRLDDAGP